MPSSKARPTEPVAQPSKGDLTRQKVLSAAHELFLKQGFHGTSMRQIAAASGLALAGIYNHFSDKDALFAAVLDAYHPYRDIIAAIEADDGATKAEYFRNLILHIRQALMRVRSDLLPLAFMDIVEFQGKHIRQLATDLMPKFLSTMPRVMHKSGKLAVSDVRQVFLILLANVVGFMAVRLVLGDSLATHFAGITEEKWFDIQMEVALRGLEAEPARPRRKP